MSDYRVLYGDTMNELREDVLALLTDGWELVGGVSVTSWPSTTDGTEFLYIQAMVKHEAQ